MTVQITALPIPPSRDDPVNFAPRADAFLMQLPTFATEANALAIEANTNTNINFLFHFITSYFTL
jgi:hypothetical protein